VWRIFGPRTRCWRKLHNEEFHDLYSLPIVIRMRKSRTRWAGHIAQMGIKRNAWRILVKARKESGHCEVKPQVGG
jgi:hypothetical protein